MNYNFISIPRTGTQSIRKVLGYKPFNHTCIDKLPKAYSFTFFREPIDRLKSWFFWHKYKDVGCKGFYYMNFNKWVEMGCPHHWSDYMLKSLGIKNPLNQWEFIVINNKIAVDFIGDFAHLQRDFKKVCKIIKQPQTRLPKIGVSNKKNEILTQKNKIYLRNRFNRDFHIYANKLSYKCCGDV